MPRTDDKHLTNELRLFDQLPDSAHVRISTVCALYGNVTCACIWKWVKAKKIPEPIKIGPQVTAWRVGELRRDLASKAKAA